MIRQRFSHQSIFFLLLTLAFLPLSLHTDSLRLFLTTAKKWLSLLSSGNSLTEATRSSIRLFVDSTAHTRSFITVHRVTAASPTCTLTAPADGATVSGASTSVTANATSSKTITNVQFNLDGSALGSADTTSPYGITWDTTGTGNGTHTLSCTTKNQYNETTTSAPLSVTVSNDLTPPVRSAGAPSTSLAAGTTSTSISLTTDENATCKYATSAGTAYASMSTTFGTTGSTSQSTTVSGLSNGNTYSYYVRCQDSFSNPNTDDYTITFSVLNPSGDGVAPSVPGNVQATPTVSTVALTWDASTDNTAVTGYKIFRDSVEIATSVSTSYTNTGLTPGISYDFEIAAYDAAANVSVHSSTVTTTTLTDTNAPSVPANLAASGTSASTVALTWDASTDNVAVTGYKIFRDSIQIGTSAGPLYNDAGLTALTSYSYEVLAYDGASLESAHSSSVTASTTDTPAETPWEESEKKYEKPKKVLKQGTSVVARGEILTQSGRRFVKNGHVWLFFQRADGTYYQPLMVKTDAKGDFSVSYRVNKPAGVYKWYAVEERTGRKTPKRTYTVYDPKKEWKPPEATKKKNSSRSTHSS